MRTEKSQSKNKKAWYLLPDAFKSNRTWNDISTKAYIEWLENQNFRTWRIVTLTCRCSSNKAAWRDALVQTFRETEQNFIKGTVLAQNIAQGFGKQLIRFVAFGEDKKNDTKLHVHCLINGIGCDERFTKILEKAWFNHIKREVEKRSDVEVMQKDVGVYLDHTDGITIGYADYIVRAEGKDFAIGLDKVVVDATRLK